ncbi:MAG: hypothetical protein RIR73_2159 [Chloroflexota bacterium]
MKKTLQKTTIALITSFITALLVNVTAYALHTTLSEQGTRFFWWYGPNINDQYSSDCRGSGTYNCKWKNQVQSNESMYFWAANKNNVTDWYAFVPYNGDAYVNYSVSYYDSNGVKLWWYITLNQINPQNWGKFKYLGTNDDPVNTKSHLYL